MANAVELGVAYLSLVVESKGVPAQVQRALSGVPAEGRRAGAALGRSMSDAAASAAQFDRLQRNAGAAQLKAAAATNTLAQASARASKAGAGLASGCFEFDENNSSAHDADAVWDTGGAGADEFPADPANRLNAGFQGLFDVVFVHGRSTSRFV